MGNINRRSLYLICSVDFAKLRDNTAISVSEVIEEYELDPLGPFDNGPATRRNVRNFLHIRALRRLEVGKSYPDVIQTIQNIMGALPPMPQKPVLIGDLTGPGVPVFDYMRRSGLRPIGICFTGGLDERKVSSVEWHVPKKNLVSAFALMVEDGRLKIAPELPDKVLLEEELRAFTLKVRNSGHQAFEADTESSRDDLVASVMMAAWFADKKRPIPAHYTTAFQGYMER